jgi:hypothetical protein
MSSTPPGNFFRGGTRLPAPTIVHGWISQLSRRIEPIPTMQSSPTRQPWRMTPWPTVTRAPTWVSERPPVVCATVPSCTEVPAPMRIGAMSPRIDTLGQTLTSAPSSTSPMIVAAACTKAEGSIRGVCSR